MAIGTEWTTDALLASIRRRACFPTGDEAWGDTDILALATEAMRDYILPTIRDVREEFLIETYDISVTAGTTSYRLPPRVAAEALRLVLMSDGNGGYVPMTRVEPETARKLQIGFYLESDKIVLSWMPTQTTTVRLKYYFRPSKLVGLTEALSITNGGGGALIGADATNVAGFSIDSICDTVRGVPGFRILDLDGPIGDISGYPNIVITTSQPAADYTDSFLCLKGESCVPQIPAELHPLLAQRVAVKLGEGQSPTPGYDAALTELDRMEKRAISMFSERTEGNPRFVHNFYAPGWGRNVIRRQTGGL